MRNSINYIKTFWILPCVVAVTVFFICSAFTGDKPGSSVTCDKELEKITRYYNKFSKGDRIYCKYSIQNTVNGQTGEKLVTEIWLQGARMKYVNLFMTVIQDEKIQVLIMKDTKKIIIRNTPKSKDSIVFDNGISAFIKADNLNKMGGLINCVKSGETKKLAIDFPKKSGAITNPLKQIEFEYLPKGEVKKVVYNYYVNKGAKTEHYEYLAMTDKFDTNVLSGNPVGKVMSGTKLNKVYQDFMVQDLRRKN